MEADIIIVGAGIAGLWTAIELLKKKRKTVVILEKYGYIGGRVITYSKDGHQWENGAGRISSKHTMVLDLLKRYKLKTFPLSDKSLYSLNGHLSKNTFNEMILSILPLLDGIDLATTTLEEVLHKVLGKEKALNILDQFAYNSEMTTLRADLAIKSFQEDMTHDTFYVVKGGLSSLIRCMVNEFQKLGGHIFCKQDVLDVTSSLEVVAKTDAGTVLWKAPKVILALHSDAIKQLLPTWSTLKHLKMEPLLRTYAVFPTPWFSDLDRVVTGGPIRYFIPISDKVSMISYTDGNSARPLLEILEKKGEDGLRNYLMEELRMMFPDRDIPDPIFFKAHPWYSGCTYWLPGNYDVIKESKKSIQPFSDRPGLYVCGESFSLRQAWMEGALEQAELLLDSFTY